ncbi:MAG: hypothetical protein AAF497_03405 [Planctomycetota bacterium]
MTELLDTDKHGYHADIDIRAGTSDGSTKYRGSGEKLAYGCPKCGQYLFGFDLVFDYWDVGELAEEFDGRWEDLFNGFACQASCSECGHISDPTEFGKL